MTYSSVGSVAEIWRYPVQSIRGQSCQAVTLRTLGQKADTNFGVYAKVIEPGSVQSGDSVSVESS